MMGLITILLACVAIRMLIMSQAKQKPAEKPIPVQVRRNNYPQ